MPGLTPEEVKNLILSVGTHRGVRRITPVEVGQLLVKSIDAGASSKTCAAVCDVSASMIARFRRLQKLSPRVRHLVDWGHTGITLSFSSAEKLASLPTDEQDLLCLGALENGLTRWEVEEVIRLRKASKQDVRQCISDVVRLRTVIERHYVYVGGVTDASVRSVLATLTQLERDRLLTETLGRAVPQLSSTQGKLGQDVYTIVAAPADADFLRELGGEELEKSINAELSRRISES